MGDGLMSAAAIAAMTVCIEEDRRRRDPDYEPLVSMYDVISVPWAGPALLIISIAFCAAMLWISLR